MYRKEELVKPFSLQGGNIGILLIHGFTACPIDLKPLGEILNRFGYTVYAPLLAGHGRTPEELRGTSWEDWLASAEDGVNFLRESCRRVVAVGHSMGGLLGLALAARGKLDGVIAINSPIIYQDRNVHFAERLLNKQEYAAKPHKEKEISFTDEGLPHYSYIQVPVKALVSLNKAIPRVQRELAKIHCPALIIQGLEDKTVHPRSARMIEKSIKNRQKDVIYWAKEDHYLILGRERQKLADKIKLFLSKYGLAVQG